MIMNEEKLKTQKDYRRIAEIYAKDFGNENDNYEIVDRAISLLRKADLIDNKVIDLGSGPGNLSEYLYKHGLHNLTLVEFVPEFISILKRRLPKVNIVEEEMTKFLDTCDKDSVGGIFAGFSIIHIPDNEVDELFSNIFKTLVTKGIFFMSCHKGNTKGLEIEPYQIDNDPRLNTDEKLEFYSNYFTEAELEKRLKKVGFRNIEINTFTPIVRSGDMPVPKILLTAQKL